MRSADRVRVLMVGLVAPVTQALYLAIVGGSAREIRGPASLLVLLAAAGGGALVFALAGPIVLALGGGELPGAVPVLRVLCLLPFLTGLTAILGANTLLAEGRGDAYAASQIAVALLGVPLAVLAMVQGGAGGRGLGGGGAGGGAGARLRAGAAAVGADGAGAALAVRQPGPVHGSREQAVSVGIRVPCRPSASSTPAGRSGVPDHDRCNGLAAAGAAGAVPRLAAEHRLHLGRAERGAVRGAAGRPRQGDRAGWMRCGLAVLARGAAVPARGGAGLRLSGSGAARARVPAARAGRRSFCR